MKNFLLIVALLFGSTFFLTAQEECCIGIELNVEINDCEVTICPTPTGVSNFCEDFDYQYQMDVFDENGSNVQTLIVDEHCFPNFQGIPGMEYTITYKTGNTQICEDINTASISFSVPADCQNCCVPHEVQAQVEECVLQYCFVPVEPLCEAPFRANTRIFDPFGNLVFSSSTSGELCFEVPGLTGGLEYTVGGALNYELACDVGADVIPTTITIPEECEVCENECLEVLSLLWNPIATNCNTQIYLLILFDNCTGQFVSSLTNYDILWSNSNGPISTTTYVFTPTGTIVTVQVIDDNGCEFTDELSIICPGSPLTDSNIDTRSNEIQSLSLSPNPTRDILTIRGLSATDNVSVSIFNSNGQSMGTWESEYNSELAINVQSFPVGQYFVLAMNGHEQISSEIFMKQ